MKSKALIQVICFMIILLFAYAAFSKLADHAMFYVQLASIPLLSSFAGFISWALPLVEVVIVILLLFQKTLLYGLYTSAVLLSLFVLFLSVMVIFTTHLPCSCGGVIAKLSWQQHIIFNLFFIVLSATGIKLHRTINKQPENI